MIERRPRRPRNRTESFHTCVSKHQHDGILRRHIMRCCTSRTTKENNMTKKLHGKVHGFLTHSKCVQ
jgi:hypothetical protein